jgi:hypothetical protein
MNERLKIVRRSGVDPVPIPYTDYADLTVKPMIAVTITSDW